jgi:hypothetical protein
MSNQLFSDGVYKLLQVTPSSDIWPRIEPTLDKVLCMIKDDKSLKLALEDYGESINFAPHLKKYKPNSFSHSHIYSHLNYSPGKEGLTMCVEPVEEGKVVNIPLVRDGDSMYFYPVDSHVLTSVPGFMWESCSFYSGRDILEELAKEINRIIDVSSCPNTWEFLKK